jgi:predicted metal-dependent HD superfamily phosphohydrolase
LVSEFSFFSADSAPSAGNSHAVLLAEHTKFADELAETKHIDYYSMLKETFLESARAFTGDNALTEKMWTEIEQMYSVKKRHYHTLAHLENVYNELLPYKDQVEDWHCLVFAIVYHDAVYNALKRDNEEKSAVLAEERMKFINAPSPVTERCKEHIRATKSHRESTDPDTNLFTDADLSILGQDWEIYLEYCRQVRKEYSIYPDLMYNPGRKKALDHFLQMERIFKTNAFFEKYELKAKENMKREISEVLG